MSKKIVTQLKEKLGDRIKEVKIHNPKRIYINVASIDVPEVVRYIFEDLDARFAIASGVDTPEGIEILYHLSLDATGEMLSVRALLDRKKPEIESITPVIKGAEWIEREIWEMLGVNFKNHPNLTHLLLTDDWPKGNYPLRRYKDE